MLLRMKTRGQTSHSTLDTRFPRARIARRRWARRRRLFPVLSRLFPLLLLLLPQSVVAAFSDLISLLEFGCIDGSGGRFPSPSTFWAFDPWTTLLSTLFASYA